MKRSLEDFLAGLPPQEGNGGQPVAGNVAASRAAASPRETQIDRTAYNARRVVAEETQLRAEKTAALKAAREQRDALRKG